MENLAWACAEGNSYKGTDLAGLDRLTGALERLFNPGIDSWNLHFSWRGPDLFGETPEGRVTIHVLQINRPERVALRRELMAANLFYPTR